MQKIFFRTNHRIIVGLPLCMPNASRVDAILRWSLGRDPGWNDLNQTYMDDTIKEAFFLMLIPRIMIP